MFDTGEGEMPFKPHAQTAKDTMQVNRHWERAISPYFARSAVCADVVQAAP